MGAIPSPARMQRLSCVAAAAFVACLCTATGCFAARVTTSQARTAVANWLLMSPRPLGAQLGSRTGGARPYAGAGGSAEYYVVPLAPSGFVVAAGDDLIEPIICFSSSGSYDPSPSNPLGALVTKDLASRFAAIRGAAGRSLDPDARERLLTAKRKWARLLGVVDRSWVSPAGLTGPVSDVRVSPIIESKWSQETASTRACYNYYTPPGTSGDSDNYPCGCVATAMAQLMRFHQHPTDGVGTKSFTIKVDDASQTRKLRGGDGMGGPYDYGQMPLVPSFSTSLTERRMIGALCHDAGVAVGTSYSADGSAASLQQADTAMTDVFHFSNSVFGHNSMAQIGAGLAAMVNTNLDAGLPVLLAVHVGTAGHALVCDGYGYNASTLYHHLNLGWSGLDDAWYNLPNVDAPSGAYDTVDQCLYNIFPNGSGEIISGRVTDNLGRAVVGAGVTATRSGGGSYTTSTNDKGIYALTALPSSSTYTIAVEKEYHTFASRTANTGRSQDDRNRSGNVWQVDFSGTYTPDITPPSCTVSGPAGPTSVWPIVFSIKFSEPMQGLALADIEISGAVKTAVTGSGADYAVTAMPSASGEVTCRLPAGVALDLAGNTNTASNTASVLFQDPLPVVVFTKPADGCTRNCDNLGIEGTAADNSDVTSVTWSNDRGGSGECTGLWKADSVPLAAGPNVITVTATDAAGLVGRSSITVSYVECSPGDAWQGRAMVSMPMVPDITDPAPIVGFEGSGWFAYDSVLGYLGYSEDTRSWLIPKSATPVRGFWAYFPPTGGLKPCGTVPPQDQAVTIFLKSGWNLIGQPFITPVSWNSTAIRVRVGGEEGPLSQYAHAVASYAWGWDSAAEAYYLVSDSRAYPHAVSELEPWHAYWVRAYRECELVIPAP